MKLLSLILIASFAFSSCVPSHINQHESLEISQVNSHFQRQGSRCDGLMTRVGTSTYILKHPAIQTGSLDLTKIKNSERLKIDLAIFGRTGTRVQLSTNKIRYRYDGENWSEALGMVTATHFNPGWAVPGAKSAPPQESILMPYEYIFTRSNIHSESKVGLVADMPMKKQNLEIELPQIEIDSDVIAPNILRFEWSDRWTTSPLNGC